MMVRKQFQAYSQAGREIGSCAARSRWFEPDCRVLGTRSAGALVQDRTHGDEPPDGQRLRSTASPGEIVTVPSVVSLWPTGA